MLAEVRPDPDVNGIRRGSGDLFPTRRPTRGRERLFDFDLRREFTEIRREAAGLEPPSSPHGHDLVSITLTASRDLNSVLTITAAAVIR